MTRRFNVEYVCSHCGMPSTAETGFGRWMRANQRLDSALGIVRTDHDHTICRYKTHTDGRDFQLMMIVEVKEFGKDPDKSQNDIFGFTHQFLLDSRGRNMHGAVTAKTLPIHSFMLKRHVLVRHYGCHLLQFEKTSPDDSRWIKWNGKEISGEMLLDLIAMDRVPDKPHKMMDEYLRDRHRKKPTELMLWPSI